MQNHLTETMPDPSKPTGRPEFTKAEMIFTAFLALGMAGFMLWHYRFQALPCSVDILSQNQNIHDVAEISDGKLDINLAKWHHFALLPRIGEKLGKRIVQDREENGPFKSVEDLARVPGVGQSLLEAIKPYIMVRAKDGECKKITDGESLNEQ